MMNAIREFINDIREGKVIMYSGLHCETDDEYEKAETPVVIEHHREDPFGCELFLYLFQWMTVTFFITHLLLRP